MVGDDALVLPLAVELDVVQLQRSGVLGHVSALRPHVRLVDDLRLVQVLVVLLPGEGHGRVAGAGRRADEGHVRALDGRLGLGLHCDLGLREVICERT